MADKKRVFLLSGLATDDRVFHKLKLENAEVKTLLWLQPYNKESLASYVNRMVALIPPGTPPILIGYSFGGIVAMEMAQHIPTEKVIIIASILSPKEIPWNIELVKLSHLYEVVPARPVSKIYPLAYFIFGTETREEERMLREIIQDADEYLLQWSIKQVLEWKGCPLPQNLYRLHGTHDNMFPIRLCEQTIPVEKGTHLMVVSRAELVNKILNQIIRNELTEAACSLPSK